MERQPYQPPGSTVAKNSYIPASVETVQGGVPPYGVKETPVVNGKKIESRLPRWDMLSRRIRQRPHPPCTEPYLCPSSRMACHTTKRHQAVHQEYALSLPGVYEL